MTLGVVEVVKFLASVGAGLVVAITIELVAEGMVLVLLAAVAVLAMVRIAASVSEWPIAIWFTTTLVLALCAFEAVNSAELGRLD